MIRITVIDEGRQPRKNMLYSIFEALLQTQNGKIAPEPGNHRRIAACGDRLKQTVDESSEDGFEDIIFRVRALKEVMPI